jgi:hypothetical protein
MLRIRRVPQSLSYFSLCGSLRKLFAHFALKNHLIYLPCKLQPAQVPV